MRLRGQEEEGGGKGRALQVDQEGVVECDFIICKEKGENEGVI